MRRVMLMGADQCRCLTGQRMMGGRALMSADQCWTGIDLTAEPGMMSRILYMFSIGTVLPFFCKVQLS
jgi:hypothetical protein